MKEINYYESSLPSIQPNLLNSNKWKDEIQLKKHFDHGQKREWAISYPQKKRQFQVSHAKSDTEESSDEAWLHETSDHQFGPKHDSLSKEINNVFFCQKIQTFSNMEDCLGAQINTLNTHEDIYSSSSNISVTDFEPVGNNEILFQKPNIN